MADGGIIQGIADSESPATIFFLIPVGLRVVALQNEATSGYIAMNSEGRIYTTVSTGLFIELYNRVYATKATLCQFLTYSQEFFTPECRFKESVFENYWCLYSSIQYKHPETKVVNYIKLSVNSRFLASVALGN